MIEFEGWIGSGFSFFLIHVTEYYGTIYPFYLSYTQTLFPLSFMEITTLLPFQFNSVRSGAIESVGEPCLYPAD